MCGIFTAFLLALSASISRWKHVRNDADDVEKQGENVCSTKAERRNTTEYINASFSTPFSHSNFSFYSFYLFLVLEFAPALGLFFCWRTLLTCFIQACSGQKNSITYWNEIVFATMELYPSEVIKFLFAK